MFELDRLSGFALLICGAYFSYVLWIFYEVTR